MLTIISCSSSHIYKEDGLKINTNEISYVVPLFDLENEKVSQSKSISIYLKYANKSIDSVLAKETGIFNFKRKISLDINDDVFKSIKSKFNRLIADINLSKSLENAKMPSEFESLEDFQIDYLLSTYVQPKFYKVGGVQTRGSKSSPNYEISYSSPGYRYESEKYHFFIFDVKAKKVISYTSSKKFKNHSKDEFVNLVYSASASVSE